ncbi:hypothetical protein ACFQZQ_09760 [Lysobacter koreensis]|uniref:Uncharacterized protein n=1 Tax=Lysobacter koreensis TaxID=266122 RepID=A0ABW2YMH2_9GAMM
MPDKEGVHVDRQDAKPHRPSLLSGGEDRSAAPLAPRILADMENRAPRRGPARVRKPRPLLLASGVAVVALLAGFWWFGGRAEDSAGQDMSVAQIEIPGLPVPAASVPRSAAAAPDAAMIVAADDTPTNETDGATTARSAADNPFAAAAPSATAAVASRPANPPSIKPASRPLALRAQPTASASAAPPKPALASATSKRSGDEDLLATLLKNIEQRNSAPPVAATPARADPAPFSVLQRPQAGSDQDALDSLVRQVRDRDSQAATATAVAGARALRSNRAAAAGATPAIDTERSGQIQAKLRQCPRANTRQGLACRQKVCANHAGQDPACPAPVRR